MADASWMVTLGLGILAFGILVRQVRFENYLKATIEYIKVERNSLASIEKRLMMEGVGDAISTELQKEKTAWEKVPDYVKRKTT